MASRAVAPTALPTLARPHAPTTASAAARWDRVARWLTWTAFVAILLLGILAPLMRTGDSQEYYAMALAVADLRPPALTLTEVEAFQTWLRTRPAGSGFPDAVGAMDQPWLIANGRQVFLHFWLYPLLAAPVVVLTKALTLPAGYAFLAINAGLLALALWLVQRAFSPVVGLLMLASPLVWFINKAQVEVFTVSLLAIAIAQARQGHFLWAGLAAAIAATQNVPILGAVAVFWAAGLARHLIRRQTPRLTWPAAALVMATLVIGALNPLYYLWRLGVLTPQRLNDTIALRLPSPETYLAVLIDPNIGFLSWMPLSGLLAAVGLVLVCLPRTAPPSPPNSRGEHAKPPSPNRGRRAGGEGFGVGGQPDDLRLAALCGLVIGAWFLVVFAQTTNLNSGGTVHVSRYALWLLPLGLPLLAATADWLRSRVPALLPIAGLAAVIGYGLLFQPARAEHYLTPSPQAAFLMTWAPELYRPLPEIFVERQRRVDGGVQGSAATADCRMILLHAAAPEIPCRLSPKEASAARGLLADGWQAVWIIRPGPLGLAEGRVAGALAPP